MKRYQNPPDNRPLDDWGKPIGKSYHEKQWDELTPEEMMMDFEWKSDILESLGEEISFATFYQDYLFRELYAGELEGDYKVMLTEYVPKEKDEEKSKTKIYKIDVDDIADYLHQNNVALSPCLFHNNWRRKNLMNYVSAFVLDIDKLRPMNLQRFFMLFDEGRLLRPTFIANSGSGVHFYYLLDKMLPVDSVKLHGKLCFIECDIRTHLTRAMQYSRPGVYPEGIYTTEDEHGSKTVWSGPDTADLSISALRKAFARL